MSNGSTHPGTPSTPIQVDTLPPICSQVETTSALPRSASYTQLPTGPKIDATPQRKPSLSRSFSENVLANIQGNVSRHASTKKGPEDGLKLSRRSIRRLGPSRRQKDLDIPLSISTFAIGPDPFAQDLTDESETRNDGKTQSTERKAPSIAGPISTLARKSWIGRSRSPSPSPTKTRVRKENGLGVESTRHINGLSPAVDAKTSTSSAAKVTDHACDVSSNGHAKKSLSRRNSVLSRRPLSTLLSKASPSETPTVPPLPTSFSTDRLPLASSLSLSSKPPVPKSCSSERLQGPGAETPRKKDELWGVFRTLDGEYQK